MIALVHGKAISAEDIERIVSRQFSPTLFAAVCNAIAWASAGEHLDSLPSFTERVNVADGGVGARWQVGLPAGTYKSALLGPGSNVFQYKQRDI